MPRLKHAEFIDLLRRSRLLDEDRLQGVIVRFQEQSIGDDPSPELLAQFMVADGSLTDWQANNLLDRKYRGFFLGNYLLLRKLGRGGMSTVYLAEHRHMHRQVAIKVLPKQLVGETSYLARFYREARAFAALDHPNIVRAYDIDHQDETHYLVMEFVDGQDLHAIVRSSEGRLDCELVAFLIAQAALGLRHIHEGGLVHRDIKPANLMIDAENNVKILDMGIARFQDSDRGSLTVEHDEQVLGTVDYLAPEQALDSHEVDPRADIYSLGCTLYFALAGRPPFLGGTLAQRIAKHQTAEPDDLRQVRVDCPNALASICRRMMAKLPEDRFASAGAVAHGMIEWLRDVNSQYARRLAVEAPPAAHAVPRRAPATAGAQPLATFPRASTPHAAITNYVASASTAASPTRVESGSGTSISHPEAMPVIVVNGARRGRAPRRGRSQRTPLWLWIVMAILMLLAIALWIVQLKSGGFVVMSGPNDRHQLFPPHPTHSQRTLSLIPPAPFVAGRTPPANSW